MTTTASSSRAPVNPCPCGGADYAACCGPLHAGGRHAATALELMRARYSAYVKRCSGYLRATWDPATCPATLDDATPIQWLGLQVVAHTTLDDTHAEVEFMARYRVHGRAYHLHERSRFRVIDGQWRYVDGEIFN